MEAGPYDPANRGPPNVAEYSYPAAMEAGPYDPANLVPARRMLGRLGRNGGGALRPRKRVLPLCPRSKPCRRNGGGALRPRKPSVAPQEGLASYGRNGGGALRPRKLSPAGY